MKYLGSERSITQDFVTHKVAEDYSGNHKSEVKMNGRGRVIKVINRFKSHEDSINYNTFLENQKIWFINGVYNCVSITGKSVKMSDDELGGNQIWIETFEGNNKLLFRFCHLDSVLVTVDDIVDENTVLGLQGNTGLVLSGKSVTDVTYGTHVHFEVTKNNEYINPRKYASGEIVTTYQNYDNGIDPDKDQIKILVKQINIRKNADEKSTDLGDVYYDEYYNVLDIVDSDTYTWYKIKTENNITGYVASLNGGKWLEYRPKENKNEPIISPLTLIYTCEKTGKYIIQLYEKEKLYIEKSN